MGLRTACIGCQRATNIIRFIAEKEGLDLSNYLDAFGGVDDPLRAWEAFDYLGWLLQYLGFDESAAKACKPSTSMIHLGILFNTVKMTMEVTPDRVADTLRELKAWQQKVAATRREIQSLVGKLIFVAKCVRQGRIFLSRLLNLLRDAPLTGRLSISGEAQADIKWFSLFLPSYSGVSLIPDKDWSDPDAVLASDACLVGCGATCEKQYFTSPFPPNILALGLHISALELLAVAVAVKLWAPSLGRKKLVVYCDNEATVITINSGKTRDRFMQGCIRELCYVAGQGSFEVKAIHLPGVANRLPDLLSRCPLDPSTHDKFIKLTEHSPLKQAFVNESMFEFEHDW